MQKQKWASMLRKIDCRETRTGLLLLWLTVFCCSAGGWAIQNSKGLVALFPFMFGGWALLTAIFYFSQTLAFVLENQPQYAQPQPNAIFEAEYIEVEANEENTAQSVKLTEQSLQARLDMHEFLRLVICEKILGEPTWVKKTGKPGSQFRTYIKFLETDGIVTEGGRGKDRFINVGFEEALEIIRKSHYDSTGELDYWFPVKMILGDDFIPEIEESPLPEFVQKDNKSNQFVRV